MDVQSKSQQPEEVVNVKDNLDKSIKYLRYIINGRRKIRTILAQERAALDKLASDVRICKIAGGVGGVVGSGLVIGGFAAASFTFGTSLILSVVGAGIGAAGTVTSSGASIADTVISKQKRKLINDLLKNDARLLRRFEDYINNLKLSYHAISIATTLVLTTKDIVQKAIGLVRVVDVAVDGSRTAFGVLRGAAKVFAIAGVMVSIVSLPFDIGMALSNSISHHNGNKHKISVDFRKFENDIKEELVPMQKMMLELEEAKSTMNTL